MTRMRRWSDDCALASRRHAAATLALALVICGLANAADSTGGDTTPVAPKEFSLFEPQEASFRFSYGFADHSLNFYTFGPRVAYDLPDFVPALFDNRFRIAIELMGSIIHGHKHDLDGEFAFTPLLLDYRYDTGSRFVPFFDGGEGIVLTTLDDLRLGGPFEFSSQVGGGLHYFYSAQGAITIAARYRHISNAGIKDENSGLNTVFVTVGIGRFPDRR
jgi:hypothetical protein